MHCHAHPHRYQPISARALFTFLSIETMQVSIMKLISTILLASTAAALKQRAAPMKALQVPRGGGMVEKSQALTVIAQKRGDPMLVLQSL